MRTSDYVYVGIRGTVLALDRRTGEQIWATHLKGGAFVNVVLEGNTILATTYGEIFCIDALTGSALWHNRLKGYGMGLTAIATVNNPGGNATLPAEEQRREAERRAAAA